MRAECYSLPEHASRPGRTSRPPLPRPGSPARAHRELAQAELARRARAGGGNTGETPPDRPPAAASSTGRGCRGQRVEEALAALPERRPTSTPRPRGSPARGRASRACGRPSRESSEWTSSQMRVHDRAPSALEVADEVPAEGVAVDGVLRLEILRAVLADDLDAGLGERGHVLDGDVLRRRDHRDSRPDLFPSARSARGSRSGDIRDDPLTPRDAADPGGGRSTRSGWQTVHCRAVDADARLRGAHARSPPEVEPTSRTTSLRMPRARRRDLCSHLVAAGTDPRADRGRDVVVTERGDAPRRSPPGGRASRRGRARPPALRPPARARPARSRPSRW